mmetsp:Transcript_12397/g.40834  ORF Transcript_12397/g.40834 Transcript_12397/m.40834 type:complete len:475 (-) Transcript_12397:1315-2739(-)
MRSSADRGGRRFNAAQLSRGTRGQLERWGPPGSVCTDTRSLRPGQWFLALTGERFDGSVFAPYAAKLGCAGVISERPVPAGWQAGYVRVEDAQSALEELARVVRETFDGPVVAITGSCGKTTTREMTALALSPLGPVHSTSGNFNNHIGLPLTLLRTPASAAACVLELGMSAPGEIAALAELCSPTVRVVTNVGAAHLDGVGGTLEGVAAAKQELFDCARAGDTCVINDDDTFVRTMPIPKGAREVRYGTSEGCDVRMLGVRSLAPDYLGTAVRLSAGAENATVKLAAPGAHLGPAAAAAVAVGASLGLNLSEMASAIEAYEPIGMRLQREEIGGLTLLNDAYNANPQSMRNALRLLAQTPCTGRRVALLGDMLELGTSSQSEHERVLQWCASTRACDVLGLAGESFAKAARAKERSGGLEPLRARMLVLAPSAEELARRVLPCLEPGDVLLLKGSRGLRMDLIAKKLRAKQNR